MEECINSCHIINGKVALPKSILDILNPSENSVIYMRGTEDDFCLYTEIQFTDIADRIINLPISSRDLCRYIFAGTGNAEISHEGIWTLPEWLDCKEKSCITIRVEHPIQ